LVSAGRGLGHENWSESGSVVFDRHEDSSSSQLEAARPMMLPAGVRLCFPASLKARAGPFVMKAPSLRGCREGGLAAADGDVPDADGGCPRSLGRLRPLVLRLGSAREPYGPAAWGAGKKRVFPPWDPIAYGLSTRPDGQGSAIGAKARTRYARLMAPPGGCVAFFFGPPSFPPRGLSHSRTWCIGTRGEQFHQRAELDADHGRICPSRVRPRSRDLSQSPT